MLVIRMQRTGRKGHAMFRMVVQDSRLTPTSGKVVAYLGSYDPHAKTISVDTEKAAFYLTHGAQPSPRTARLLSSEGVKLPEWVKLPADKTRTVRHADKRRSTAPSDPVEEATPAVEEETIPTETPTEVPAENPTEETPTDTAEAVAETAPNEEVVGEAEATAEAEEKA